MYNIFIYEVPKAIRLEKYFPDAKIRAYAKINILSWIFENKSYHLHHGSETGISTFDFGDRIFGKKILPVKADNCSPQPYGECSFYICKFKSSIYKKKFLEQFIVEGF
jgi:hypothetical protein